VSTTYSARFLPWIYRELYVGSDARRATAERRARREGAAAHSAIVAPESPLRAPLPESGSRLLPLSVEGGPLCAVVVVERGGQQAWFYARRADQC
jgi:hypothetical protein